MHRTLFHIFSSLYLTADLPFGQKIEQERATKYMLDCISKLFLPRRLQYGPELRRFACICLFSVYIWPYLCISGHICVYLAISGLTWPYLCIFGHIAADASEFRALNSDASLAYACFLCISGHICVYLAISMQVSKLMFSMPFLPVSDSVHQCRV